MLVISDIHANLPALEAVLADAPDDAIAQGIRFCGDLIGYYPWPNKVIDRAQDHAFVGVRGNHDEAMVTDSSFGFRGEAAEALQWQRERITDDHLAYLQRLPYTRREQVDGTDIFMAHGSPNAPVAEYVYPEHVTDTFLERQGVDTDILLLGHTHVPFTRTVADTLVINPGSVGQPRDHNPKASYAVLDADTRSADIHRVSYDIERVADAVNDVGLPPMLADRLSSGR